MQKLLVMRRNEKSKPKRSRSSDITISKAEEIKASVGRNAKSNFSRAGQAPSGLEFPRTAPAFPGGLMNNTPPGTPSGTPPGTTPTTRQLDRLLQPPPIAVRPLPPLPADGFLQPPHALAGGTGRPINPEGRA